ncbi:DUF3021 domain-containing protein [Emergencia timonensis]|uniref:DUF3021 family protein n=1 Tax=Emergencia timonensis TaxID=1776384 RepID=UPI001D078055|nr:DUF3021 family protein [Emergencia timonensis]MCB6476326.1 DUF3021 domain-containing protein [Emergencia timonensis]
MDFKELKREMLLGFFYIYTGSIFGTYVFCSLFYPDLTFSLSYFPWMALFSLAGDATLLVFCSKKVLTEKQFLFRTVIHFILLEIVLMTFAGLLQLYESTLEAVAFFFIVLLVYFMVKLLSFKSGSKEAEVINQRIQEINKKGEDY